MRPDDLIPALLRSDSARPRITCYDDARGERIELSARVLGNWVAKAANLLQEEFDAGPGTRVALALPPHWRTLYWALAVWRVGATVVTLPGAPDSPGSGSAGAAPQTGGAPGAAGETAAALDAEVIVTDDPERTDDAVGVIVVTLAALARQAAYELPAGAIDEARELATYPDDLDPWDRAQDEAIALSGSITRSYGDAPEAAADARVQLRALRGDDPADFLTKAWSVLSADGSLVLSLDTPAGTDLERRAQIEGVSDPAGGTAL